MNSPNIADRPAAIPDRSAALKRGVRCALAVLLAFASASSFAQLAQVRPDAGQILEGLKERPPAPRPDPDVIPRTEQPRPALSPTPGLRVTVKQFRISGNTVFTEAELLAELKDYIGKELDVDGLNDAASRIRARYLRHGYFLAQAYLPRQEIRDGVVEIAVIEGRIGKLELNLKPGARLSETLLRGILHSHLKSGDLITETGLERPLLLLNDLPSAEVSSEIAPSQVLGAADLKVTVGDTGGRVTGFVDLDNSGNRFTGEHRFGVSLSLNNPIGWGDQLSFRGFTSDGNMNYGRIAYVVPAWYYGTRVGASYAAFSYALGKEFASLRAHGEGDVASLYAFHPIVRTRNTNLILQLAFEEKNLHDRTDAFLEAVDRKVVSFKIGAVGDFRDRALGGGLNAYSFTLTGGDLEIAPPTEFAKDQAASTGRKTEGGFSKVNYDFRRVQRLGEQASLLLSIDGQAASKNLTSAEKFSLGGPNGVRAYPVGEANGDVGVLFSGEFRYLVPAFTISAGNTTILSGDLTLSGFYDAGWVKLNQEPLATDTENTRTLSGYGVGVSLGKDLNYVLRANASWRTRSEQPRSDPARRVPRVWFQVIKWF